MKNIAIILLFVIAIACSSKLKKKQPVTENQAVSVIDDSDSFEQEMLALGDDMILTEEDEIQLAKAPKLEVKKTEKVVKVAKVVKAPKVTAPVVVKPQPAVVIPTVKPTTKLKKVAKVQKTKLAEPIKPVIAKKVLVKKTKRSGFMVFDKATKAMINIENCSHIIYNNKQFSQPTCLKTL